MTGPPGSSHALVDFACGVESHDLPEGARLAAGLFLADAICVGIAGAAEPHSASVRLVADGWGIGSAATALGTTNRMPVASAAFVNSFQVHCQEFDPLHEVATVHAMAVLSGALLGIAEDRNLDGQDLLLGTAIGVEVAVTLGLAAREGLRFFRPATAGALGTTLALARLLRLDRGQTLNALGLAYSQLAGTMQAHVEGSVALPVQIAHAARAAVTAVDLAGAGLDGPHDVFDGPFGYFKLYERDGVLGPLIDELGSTWRVTELSHKPFPTGRAAHAILDAARLLQAEHGFRRTDVLRMTATVPPLVLRLVARPGMPGMSSNYARLCLRFLLACLLEDGRIDAASFRQANRNDAELLAFGDRIEFVEETSHGSEVLSPQSLQVELNDSTLLSLDVPDTLGSPANPLSEAARRAKFDSCLEGSDVDAEPLWRALGNINDIESTRALMALTIPRH